MRRGTGYCENADCEEYGKGVFLLDAPVFNCPRCGHKGHAVLEEGRHSGLSRTFKEVRIEFDYDPINHMFQKIAIVRDDSLQGRHSTYTLRSPVIKTEKRALKVAEAILGNLNLPTFDRESGNIPTTNETVFYFDDPREVFAKKLAQFAELLRESQLAAG